MTATSSTITRRLAVAAAVLALMPVAAAAAQAPPPRSLAALRVTQDPDIGIVNVPKGHLGHVTLEVVSHDGEPQHATVSFASDAGTHLAATQRAVDFLTDGDDAYGFPRVQVQPTPGLHEVDVTVSSDGRPDTRLTVLVWGEGGAPPPATGNLAGVHTAARYVVPGDSDNSSYYVATLNFLDKSWVYLNQRSTLGSTPAAPIPTHCTASMAGCQRYYYDPSTAMVQIGGRRGIVGDVITFDNHRYQSRFVLPRPGTHVRAIGYYRINDPYARANTYQLSLGETGNYYRRVHYENDVTTTFTETGVYRIGPGGSLTLTPDKRADGHRNKVVHNTIGFVLNAGGKASAASKGMYALGILFTPNGAVS